MDVSCCLLVIFTPQGCLNSIHAELQVEDVISSLNGLIESILQDRQRVRLPATGWTRESLAWGRQERKKQTEVILLYRINDVSKNPNLL